MSEEQSIVYPYIPNSVPEVKEQMLREVGAESTEDFFADDGLQLARVRGGCH